MTNPPTLDLSPAQIIREYLEGCADFDTGFDETKLVSLLRDHGWVILADRSVADWTAEALAELAALHAERDALKAENANLRISLQLTEEQLDGMNGADIEARALLVRAGEAFGVIHRRLASGTLTFDELIRETGFVDDLARALLAAITRATQTDTDKDEAI